MTQQNYITNNRSGGFRWCSSGSTESHSFESLLFNFHKAKLGKALIKSGIESLTEKDLLGLRGSLELNFAWRGVAWRGVARCGVAMQYSLVTTEAQFFHSELPRTIFQIRFTELDEEFRMTVHRGVWYFCGAVRWRVSMLCCVVLCCVVLCCALRCGAVQCSAVHCLLSHSLSPLSLSRDLSLSLALSLRSLNFPFWYRTVFYFILMIHINLHVNACILYKFRQIVLVMFGKGWINEGKAIWSEAKWLGYWLLVNSYIGKHDPLSTRYLMFRALIYSSQLALHSVSLFLSVSL